MQKKMKMMVISGLLGAGKTTLLLQLVCSLQEKYSRIAIVENEVGKIGIDGRYLETEGLYVQELHAGCICCTLSIDLLHTLKKLQRLYDPELVVLEPTGAARPGDVLNALNRYESGVEPVGVVSVIDAPRIRVFKEILEPLVRGHLETAEIVVISKIDQVDRETLAEVLAEVCSMGSNTTVLPVNLLDKPDLAEIGGLIND